MEQPGGLGDVGVGRWAGVHGLLYETEKQLAPASGFSQTAGQVPLAQRDESLGPAKKRK